MSGPGFILPGFHGSRAWSTEMSDKSLKPFDPAALVAAGQGAAADTSSEVASSQAAPEAEVGAPSAAPAQTPAFVTREDLLAILDEQSRRTQSALDKRDRNLQKLIARQQAQDRDRRILEVAQASGVVIPPDRQAVFLKALTEQELLGGDQSPVASRQSSDRDGDGADGEPAEGLDPVTARGYAIAEEYGLTSDDPEAAEVNTDSPQAYFQSIRVAGQKKINRLSKGPNPAAMPGLTPGGGPPKAGNPLEKINTPGTLYKMAGKKFREKVAGKGG
jgi:hypothetical protein